MLKNLIDHLRQSGTGKAKLAIVPALAEASGSAEEFLAKCGKQLPAGTVAKIGQFLESQGEGSEPVIEPPAPQLTPGQPPPPKPGKRRRTSVPPEAQGRRDAEPVSDSPAGPTEESPASDPPPADPKPE